MKLKYYRSSVRFAQKLSQPLKLTS